MTRTANKTKFLALIIVSSLFLILGGLGLLGISTFTTVIVVCLVAVTVVLDIELMSWFESRGEA